jgi:serine/threonine-protein kinase
VCAQCGRGLNTADDSRTVVLDAPAPFRPGSAFGRYRIEALLGQGGMGAVYRALDTELNREVALKLVRPELASSPQAMQRFKQELLLASRISHRNVLRIHDLGDVNGLKFISMALVDGQDLAALLHRGGRLPLERALAIARQLCAALEAAHAEGVVHRDLKPQNILVDGSDHVYISDFGLAKSLEAEVSMGTRTGQILGTPRYMSPEQVEAKAVDARSDLYSLGLILYEMFTGELPFRGDSAMQLMYQRVSERPRDPRQANPELPEWIANLLLKCLEKDPARRYQTARDILADLEARHAPRPAGSDSISIQIPKPTRRAAALALGAVLVLAAALAVARLLPGRKAAPPGIRYYMAVLPLNLAGDEDQLRYLAEGVVDSLTARLGGLHDVYVTSNVSPAVARRPDDRIAGALGVNILVRGTIASAGDQISITIKADDVRNHRTLLNHAYQGVRRDFLAVEDQVFNGLVSTLAVERSAGERARTTLRPTQDVDAYDLYMKGRDLLHGTWTLANGQQALADFDQATKRDPGFALAYAGMADACVRIWQENKDARLIQQGLSAAEQAQRLNDSLPEVHTSLGTIYARLGRTEGAIVELRRALQLAPNSDEAWRRLGNVYSNAGQHDQEIAAFREAVRINPYFWSNHASLGATYFDLGRNEEALAEFQEVTRLAPEIPTGWANSGAIYYRLGQLDRCVESFQKAIGLNPKAVYYSGEGVALFYLGKSAEATQAFETAVQKDPQNPQNLVNLADAYRQSGNAPQAARTYDRAIAAAYKVLETNDKDSSTLGVLATAYAKKRDLAKAAELIRQARQIDPKDNDLMYREAVIRVLAGQMPAALASLKDALANGYSRVEAQSDPELAPLRARPEFADMLRSIH